MWQSCPLSFKAKKLILKGMKKQNSDSKQWHRYAAIILSKHQDLSISSDYMFDFANDMGSAQVK